jgi:hypothetical protein
MKKTYEQRVRELEDEGLTRSDAQAVVDAEDLRNQSDPKEFYDRLIAHVNRKSWWHLPPMDPKAYTKRGKFLASTYDEAAFYGIFGAGKPLEQRAKIAKPLVGDEKRIARVLGIPPQYDGMTIEQMATHDARWRNAALKKGYDAILLMSPKCFAEWKANGKIPRSLELNVLKVSVGGGASRGEER